MARVLPPSRLKVLLMADTTSFRRMAKTQVGPRDAVLEVGSALGDCTRILACHAAACVGVDLSEGFVKEARRLQPQCRFEWLDFFEEPDRLDALWAELCGLGRLKVFVDIGGDRAAADVCRVLAALGRVAAEEPARRPALVVVKSRELAAAAEGAACDERGVLLDAASWWEAAARPPLPRSSLQEKRKHSRARKAMWTNMEGDPEELAQAKARKGCYLANDATCKLSAQLAACLARYLPTQFFEHPALLYGCAGLLAGGLLLARFRRAAEVV